MKKYTPAVKNLALDLRKEGKTLTEISSITGMSVHYIRKLIHTYANRESQKRIALSKYRCDYLHDPKIAMAPVRYEDASGYEYPE